MPKDDYEGEGYNAKSSDSEKYDDDDMEATDAAFMEGYDKADEIDKEKEEKEEKEEPVKDKDNEDDEEEEEEDVTD